MDPSVRIPLPHLDRLRHLLSCRRSELGITYDALAAMTGIGRRTLVAIETGKSPGSMETWFRLANALEIGFDQIFIATTGSTSDIPVTPNQPQPVFLIRPELNLAQHSEKLGAIHPEGTRPASTKKLDRKT